VDLHTSQTQLLPSADLSIRVTVTNTSSSPIEYLYSGQEFDFWAERDGAVLWHWTDTTRSAGNDFQQFLGSQALQPGESQGGETTWTGTACGDEPLAKGSYQIRGAWVVISERDMEQTVQGWWSRPVTVSLK
jgi:hypothetical protein